MKIFDVIYYCLYEAILRTKNRGSAIEAAAAFLMSVILINTIVGLFILSRFFVSIHFPSKGKAVVMVFNVLGLIGSYIRYCRRGRGRLIAETVGKDIPVRRGVAWGLVIIVETLTLPLLVGLYYVVFY